MKTYTKNGKTYRQIKKDTARKLFAAGKEIALLQCKANPFYIFNDFITISPELPFGSLENFTFEKQFDSCVNSFEWYNCNSELGKYANFFVIE